MLSWPRHGCVAIDADDDGGGDDDDEDGGDGDDDDGADGDDDGGTTTPGGRPQGGAATAADAADRRQPLRAVERVEPRAAAAPRGGEGG